MESTAKQVIFYGAGLHAKRQLELWLHRGIIPVCFADKDVKKHHTVFRGYEVLPLSEAIDRYPDYVIYPTQTQADLLKITDYLKGLGIPEGRIKYFEPIEKRLGCSFLEAQVTIVPTDFCGCCNGIPSFKFSDIIEGIDKHNSIVDGLVAEFRSGKVPSVCKGCGCIEENLWSAESKLNKLAFNTGFIGDVCPCKCTYCNAKPNFNIIDSVETQHLFDTIKKLGTVYGNFELSLAFNNGDFTSRRDCDEILEYISAKKWSTRIPSTGLVYRESVCSLAHEGLLTALTISPDSGTPETYKRIKGIDGYHKVVKNIEKYVSANVPLELKYIILDGINDNNQDIDSFLELVSRVDVDCILSGDMLKSENRMSKQTLEMSLYFVKRCKGQNLNVTSAFFHPEDAEIINKALDEYCQ